MITNKMKLLALVGLLVVSGNLVHAGDDVVMTTDDQAQVAKPRKQKGGTRRGRKGGNYSKAADAKKGKPGKAGKRPCKACKKDAVAVAQ